VPNESQNNHTHSYSSKVVALSVIKALASVYSNEVSEHHLVYYGFLSYLGSWDVPQWIIRPQAYSVIGTVANFNNTHYAV
jgi:hypothetical protein